MFESMCAYIRMYSGKFFKVEVGNIYVVAFYTRDKKNNIEVNFDCGKMGCRGSVYLYIQSTRYFSSQHEYFLSRTSGM